MRFASNRIGSSGRNRGPAQCGALAEARALRAMTVSQNNLSAGALGVDVDCAPVLCFFAAP